MLDYLLSVESQSKTSCLGMLAFPVVIRLSRRRYTFFCGARKFVVDLFCQLARVVFYFFLLVAIFYCSLVASRILVGRDGKRVPHYVVVDVVAVQQDIGALRSVT